MKDNNFSVLLKKYIQESQLSISALAKNSGIERTLIQKYISGNRLPVNYEVVENMIELLALTQSQKNELKRSYKLEKIGHAKYNKLLLLKRIILELGNIQQSFCHCQIHYSFDKVKLKANNIEELKLLTQYILNNCLENSKIRAISNIDNQLFPIIYQYLNQNPNHELYMLLHLETCKDNILSNCNLFQFQKIIPFLNYHIHVHYVYIDNPSDYSLYPYMINTSHFTLLINDKLTSGLLLTEFNHIGKEFDEKFFLANDFIQLSKNEYEYQKECFSINTKSQSIKYYCSNLFMIPWIDYSSLEKHYIGNENNKEIILNHFLQFQKSIIDYIANHKIYLYCNIHDFDDFSITQYPVGISQKVFLPFLKEELFHIYQNMIDCIEKEENFHFHIIQSEKIKLNSNLNIQVSDDSTMINFKDVSLKITETTLNQDFQLLSMVFEEFEECLYDKKNSIEIVKNLLIKNEIREQ